MNRLLLFILIIFSQSLHCEDKKLTKDWYAGLTIMGVSLNSEEDGDIPHDLPGNKYGTFIGYKLTNKISTEIGYYQHETVTQEFSGRDEQSVKWSKTIDYKTIGIKYDLFQGRRLTGSLKLSALFAQYSSNIDNKSFTSLSPSFHLNWHISEDIDLAFNSEYSEYYVGFNNRRYLSFWGLSIITSF